MCFFTAAIFKMLPMQWFNQFEHCVLCGKQTYVRKCLPIEYRDGYIEAVGQLCRKCYSEVYGKKRCRHEQM